MRLALLLAPLAAISAPAASLAIDGVQQSAVERDSACITRRLGAAAAERVFAAATDVPPDSAALARVVLPAAEHCHARLGWNREQLERAVGESMAEMIGRHASIVLGRNGIRVAVLDRWFRSLSDTMRATLETTTAADLALSQALITDGVTDAVAQANRAAISGYLAYLLLKERIGRGLPIDPR